MTDKHLDLADRVEAAGGPSRELDAEIAVVAKAVPYDFEPAFGLGCWRAMYDNRYWDAPEYTASIDAAMSLVPDEFGRPAAFTVQRTRNFDCAAVVWHNSEFNRYVNSKGKTPALALTAAALRARATMESENGN